MSALAAPGFALLNADELEEIAARTWQNVAAYSAQYTPLVMLASLVELQLLAEDQLEYRARLQLLLSNEVRTFLTVATNIIARLAQTTEVHVHEGRSPIGYVDWPTTMLNRLVSGRDPSIFVLRQSEIHRDLPENRLLKFLLLEVARLASDVLGSRRVEGWRVTVESVRLAAEKLAHHPILAPVAASWNHRGYLAARASRTLGYREIAGLYELYDNLLRRGDQAKLLELFRQHVLVPRLEDRAFELLILFRLIEHLQAVGAQRKAIRLIGQGNGPVFIFSHGDYEIGVYFQGVPEALLQRSLYRQFMTRAALSPGARRPDIPIRVSKAGVIHRITLIEAKCSVALDTIRDGGFQLLGYLADFKLYEEAETNLMLISYGGIVRYPGWPTPISVAPFIGYTSDLANLGSALSSLALW